MSSRNALLTTTRQPGIKADIGQDGRSVVSLATLERADDILDRAAAGMRAATLYKLLFTEAEAAVILGVSPESMKVWRREGRGPQWVRIGDKLVRYSLADLQYYVASLQLEA